MIFRVNKFTPMYICIITSKDMKTTIVDKSKVKSFEDFQKLKWTNVSDSKKAEVYACISLVKAATKKRV